MEKILVLGDGLLGSELVKQTNWDFISRKVGNFNINDLHLIPDGYTIIVNCIANTDTYSDDKESMLEVNVRFVKRLTKFCIEKNIKLVHISTDYVYANNKPFASEFVPELPADNWYSKSKLLADTFMQLKSIGSDFKFLICRCSHKPKPFPYESAWEDYYTNADYVDVIAGIIIKLINNGADGVINVGTEPKTMYQLAKRTKSEVTPIYTPDHVPNNLIMDLTKMGEWI